MDVSSADVRKVSKAAGLKDEDTSCHTAKIGDYVVEGHVPAADIKRMLKEKPAIAGLSAPGMPMGSPGMEQGGAKDAVRRPRVQEGRHIHRLRQAQVTTTTRWRPPRRLPSPPAIRPPATRTDRCRSLRRSRLS